MRAPVTYRRTDIAVSCVDAAEGSGRASRLQILSRVALSTIFIPDGTAHLTAHTDT